MIRRFQNRMATSRMALPVMSIYALVLWLAMLAIDHSVWLQFAFFVVNVYLVVELNNRNALMRQFSRMVSCSYIAMMMMCPWMLVNTKVMFVQFCVIASLSLLFPTYQQRSAMGNKYWAYLFVGLASMFWPPMLYFVPLFWIAEAMFLMSFSWKSMWASIFGIFTPLWIVAPYVVYSGSYDTIIQQYRLLLPDEKLIDAVANPATLVPQSLPLPLLDLVAIAVIVVLCIIGMVHYLRNSYSDKIHVRMLYQFFMFIGIFVLVAMLIVLALPYVGEMSGDMLLAMVVVCTSPLLAHYVAFTYTRLTNISVIIFMLGIFAFTLYVHLPIVMQLPSLTLTLPF